MLAIDSMFSGEQNTGLTFKFFVDFFTEFLSLSFPSHYGHLGNWCTLILQSCPEGNKEKRTFTSIIFLHLLARFTWTLLTYMNKLFRLLSFLSDTQETEETPKTNWRSCRQSYSALCCWGSWAVEKKSCYTVIENYRELFHLHLCWFNNSFDTNYFITTHYYTLSNT